MIRSIDDVKKIVGIGNVNRQVVIIYQEKVIPDIEELELSLDEIKAGRRLSKQIDLIELEDQVDMAGLINRIERHPSVLVAEKNRMVKTMPEE